MNSFVSLREVVEKNTGSQNPKQKPDEAFWYIDVGSVDNENKKIIGARYLIGSEAPSRARKLVREKDIIVSTVRPNLNAVSMVPGYLDNQIASTGFCVLRAKQTILPEYLFFFACSQGFIQSLSSLVAGAMYPAVTDSQVLDQRLPLPSLMQQHRIVDILTRAESIVRLRREALKKTQEIIPALFVDMFGDPATNPKEWPIRKVGDFSSVQTGSTPNRENPAYYIGNIPWVKTTEVTGDIITKVGEKISESALSETNCKIFPEFTVLVAMYGQGQTRGRCGMLGIKAATNQACAAILPSSILHPEFLFALLKIEYERLRGLARGGNQPNLNLSIIKNFPVYVPPYKLQESFAQRSQQIRSIQSQATRALATAEATFQSLLHRAFAGEL